LELKSKYFYKEIVWTLARITVFSLFIISQAFFFQGMREGGKGGKMFKKYLRKFIIWLLKDDFKDIVSSIEKNRNQSSIALKLAGQVQCDLRNGKYCHCNQE